MYFTAVCLGGQGISQKEADWKGSIIFCGVQSPWDWARIWMHLFTERYQIKVCDLKLVNNKVLSNTHKFIFTWSDHLFRK